MPAHKNQHFVPRCALKPFSLDGEGKAINLFNIPKDRTIQNAPVKGQCARDYLYGKENLSAEHTLTELEGRYARIVDLLSGGGVLSHDDMEMLKFLILVQTRRTEWAIQNVRQASDDMMDMIFSRAPSQRPAAFSDTQLMTLSMRLAVKTTEFVLDLKLVIFRNKTAIDFLTCDNPAVHTNRFHLVTLKENNFGLSNSGAMFSMPLTPKLSAMCYDKATYSIPNASGTQFVDLTDNDDAVALNQLQYISASKNLYFRKWPDGARIQADLQAFVAKRAEVRPITTAYIQDNTAKHPTLRHRDSRTGKIEAYRVATPEEVSSSKAPMLVRTSPAFAEPFLWPSKMKLRPKPKCFDTHSSVGLVRKAEWTRTRRRV
jgi:Protein of unknown function (DUF4238)